MRAMCRSPARRRRRRRLASSPTPGNPGEGRGGGSAVCWGSSFTGTLTARTPTQSLPSSSLSLRAEGRITGGGVIRCAPCADHRLADAPGVAALSSPSPGNPGEGRGGGSARWGIVIYRNIDGANLHPIPPPDYRKRGQKVRPMCRSPARRRRRRRRACRRHRRLDILPHPPIKRRKIGRRAVPPFVLPPGQLTAHQRR